MKTKTKLIALLLCVVLLAVTASGCASFAKLKDKLAPDDYSVYTEPEDTNDDSVPEYDVNIDDVDDVDDSEDDKSSSSSSGSDITIEEQVIFDKEGIKITALEYQMDDYGESMEILIENNSDDDLTVSSGIVIIDGFVTSSAYFFTDVSAGNKAYDEMDIKLNEYEKECIGDVGKIEMYLLSFDDEYNEVFSNEYAQVRTSAYEEQDAEMTIPYTELENDNGVKVGFLGVNKEEYRDNQYVYFYIENNTDYSVTISTDDVSVNGIMIDSSMYHLLPANTKSINSMIIYGSDLEENKIGTIEEIELKIRAYNIEKLDSIFETDSITIKAN